MGQCKVPNYISGHRGKCWTASLRQAYRHGATIIVEDTGVPVTYDKPHPTSRRFWVDYNGNRYDSRDCIPVF